MWRCNANAIVISLCPLLVLFLGAIFLASGLNVRNSYRAHAKDGVRTTGVVTDFRSHASYSELNTVITYNAIISFDDVDGETVLFTDICSTSSRPQIGEEVRVSYVPTNTAGARNLDSCGRTTQNSIGIGTALLAVGSGLALLVIVSAVRMRAAAANGHSQQQQSMPEAPVLYVAKPPAVPKVCVAC